MCMCMYVCMYVYIYIYSYVGFLTQIQDDCNNPETPLFDGGSESIRRGLC